MSARPTNPDESQFRDTIEWLKIEVRRMIHEREGGQANIPPSTDEEFEGRPRPRKWEDIATAEQIEEMRKDSHP